MESLFSKTESKHSDLDFIIQNSKTDTSNDEILDSCNVSMMLIKLSHIQPLVEVKLLLNKYVKPLRIIAFVDIGAFSSILKPNVLPSYFWKPHQQYF